MFIVAELAEKIPIYFQISPVNKTQHISFSSKESEGSSILRAARSRKKVGNMNSNY